jgi:hypothetical protein
MKFWNDNAVSMFFAGDNLWCSREIVGIVGAGEENTYLVALIRHALQAYQSSKEGNPKPQKLIIFSNFPLATDQPLYSWVNQFQEGGQTSVAVILGQDEFYRAKYLEEQ